MTKTMTDSRYEEIIEKIKQCVNSYRRALGDNKYFFKLANGDIINLTFPRNHIAHLIGVNTEKLIAANIVNSRTSSYDILKKLIDYDLSNYSIPKINRGFDINSLFSDFIDNKTEIFNDVLRIRSNDIYCIIKYCSDRAYTVADEIEKSDYFIIRKHGTKYSVLGIVKNDDRNNYVPVTSRLYENNEELSNFLNRIAKNQEVTYPCFFRIKNYSKEYENEFPTTLDEKMAYNRTLKNLACKYSAVPSTSGDFLAILDSFQNSKQKNKNSFSILRLIRESVSSGNVVDKKEVRQMLDDERIPDELDLLIDVCNDLICSAHSDDEDVKDSYSSVQNENANLKEELESIRKELLELKARNNELEEENVVLKENHNKSSQKIKVLTDAFERIQTI